MSAKDFPPMVAGGSDFRRVCGSVLARQEDAMARLARELHDQLGGVLTAARMDLSWLQQRLPPLGDDFTARLRALDAGLAAAMNLKRGAVESLRPALLDHFGLPVALRHLFEEACTAAGTRLSAVLPDTLEALPIPAATAVFRVAEEALAGVVARPGSRHIDVVLEASGPRVRLSIEDDNPAASTLLEAAEREGLLDAMHARVAFFGGTLQAHSPAGLALLVEMPLAAEPA